MQTDPQPQSAVLSNLSTTTASSSQESISLKKKNGSSRKDSRGKDPLPQPNRNSFCLRSPPPSQHLKKILANYPEGPQILQEALQNADDARAIKFRVILDERTHRSRIPELDRFMGPAILFGNDGVFTESDWKGLQNMFESEKANEPGKIGRFGMGSRSYFHMADVITVVSGSKIAFLDPDFAINDCGGASSDISELLEVDNANPENKEFQLGEENSSLRELSEPLMGFELASNHSFFPGTLFRLPLRMGKWAKNSTFAPYEYSTAKALNIVRCFQKEAAQMLLFLQSVSEIELWRWRPSDDSPCPLFQCQIIMNPMSTGGHTRRRGLIRQYLEEQKLYGHTLKSILSQAETGVLPELEETVEIDEIEFPSQSFDRLPTTSKTSNRVEVLSTHSIWLLNIRIVPNSDLLRLLPTIDRPPVVGVALLACPPHTIRTTIQSPVFSEVDPVPLTEFTVDKSKNKSNCHWLQSTPLSPSPNDRRLLWAIQSDDNEEEDFETESQEWTPEMEFNNSNTGLGVPDCGSFDDYCFKRLKGKTFAFLPLADVSSGLPVHIHGTFQLTDNRRSLWTSVENTAGQAQRMSEWNLFLLHQSIPQLYARVLLRHAKFVVASVDLLTSMADGRTHEHLTPEEAETAAGKIVRHFYSSWPDPKELAPILHPSLPEFVRNVKNEKIMVRQVQSQAGMACRLASKRHGTSFNTSRTDTGLPPLRPVECQFLQLTDTETHVFNGNGKNNMNPLELLEEAVSQCQLLGHPVLYVPDYIRELFQKYDVEQANNPASESNFKSIGIQRSLTSNHASSRFKPSRQSGSKKGYYVITALDIFRNILIPHWSLLPTAELPTVPRFSDLMLHLCKILGRGPDKYIQKFREQCRNLPFIPVPFPGIEYDDDDVIPLKSPSQCFDPILDRYRIGCVCQPGSDFRAPDVLRVLRLWDLRQSLSWAELVQEGVSKACTVGGCHAQKSQMEAYLYQQ